jgi:hypothetical protein
MKNSTRIREEALSAAVARYQIEPDKIISVIFQPDKVLAIGEYQAKYWLLYRT